MKKLLTISIVALLSACGNNDFESAEARNILEDLSITIDTVMIDSRGKILDMRRNYSESSISEDRKYVFLYNSHSNQIQQINLDKLVWEKDYDFEVEGPNGISTMVFSTRYLGEDQFLITSYRRLGIFDASGSKVKELSISSLPISSDLDKGELQELIQYDQDGPNAVKEMFTSGIKITESGEKWFTDYRSIIHLNAAIASEFGTGCLTCS